MRANIHIFDVRHGDSIVIEIIHDGASYWVVIDSNIIKKNGVDFCPAFNFLSNKKVQVVDTVIMTHLHADHYAGLEKILHAFAIKKIVIPPFLSINSQVFNKQIHRLKGKIQEINNRTSDEEVARRALSLAHIIKFLSENEDKIDQATGPESIFRIDGIPNPIGKILLPLSAIKGQLRQIIEQGNFELDSFKQMNNSSVVLQLNLGEHTFIFGGDSTKEQWNLHERQMLRSGVTSLNGTMLKVPHHGSKHNNDKKLYSYLLNNAASKSVFVSANGKSHPDDEFFDIVNEYSLKPYCTGLAKQCMGDKVHSITGLTQLPPRFRSFVMAHRIEDLPIQCQGDITIAIDDNTTQVFNSTGNACPYRPHDNTSMLQIFDDN